MEDMVVDPSSGRGRPAAARKRLSSSARSDDSDAFLPAKHRRPRRKSATSSSSEETVIYSNIGTTKVAYVPVDVTFVWWSYGKLGQRNRVVIPSCAVHRIRKEFPTRDGHYTGYLDP
ncbi:hypothetical protein MTO96_035343 [Rhipicephalus appendiculatus]